MTADEGSPGAHLVSAWSAYVAGAACSLPRGVDPAVAEADFRRALLRQVFEPIPWDLLIAPVESLVWLLPPADRGRALRDVAVARATLPAPAWRGEEAQRAAELVRAFVRAPSPERVPAMLAAIEQVRGADARAQLLLDAIPWTADGHRATALDRALDAAFHFPDPVHAGQVVAAVVLRDPPALLEGALARARDEWSEVDARGSLLSELAGTLPAESLATLLDEAEQLDDEYVKATVLAPMMSRVAPALRAEQVAAVLRDESLKAMLHRAPRTVPTPPPDFPSAAQALAAWAEVARALPDRALAARLADAAVRFLTATAELYARSRPATR